jgi:hypothetical protein
LDASIKRLLDEVTATRATLSAYEKAPDHRARYSDDVRAALDSLERDLTIARAEFEANEASTTEEIEKAVREVASKTRSWLEEMRVRSRIGRMDASDRLDAVSRRLDQAGTEARRAMDRAGDAVGSDLSDVRRIAAHALAEVRSAFHDASESIGQNDD